MNQQTKSMPVVLVRQAGGPEVLELSQTPVPVPAGSQILIEVRAAGVNRPDIAQRLGKYPPPPGASPLLGLEVAGVVAARGDQATIQVGEPVCALVPGGGYAGYCLTEESHALPIPRGLDFVTAAGIPETFFTVWANVFLGGQLRAGETLLVHGGGSGIGTTAIQLGRAFGARVVVTAGSADKCAACRELGAEHAIDYKQSDFVSEVQKFTGSRGVDLVLDMVGGSYAARNIECLAPGGRIVMIATQGGREATIDLVKIMHKRATITGSTLRPRSKEEKARLAADLLRHVWPLLEAGKVRVMVDRVFPFEEVRAAHEYLESGGHFGKVVLNFARTAA